MSHAVCCVYTSGILALLVYSYHFALTSFKRISQCFHRIGEATIQRIMMVQSITKESFRLSGFVLLLISGLFEASNGICNNRCSKCDADTCSECYYGYWGYKCQLDCENCWHAGCEKKSGRCIQCEPGLYRVPCDRPCPLNCRGNGDIDHCNRHTGKCQDGCNLGWWGDQCQYKCSPGCQKACLQHDGACISHCRKGLFGRHCNQTCSLGCSHETCNWLTGHCHGGCKCGYVGSTCKDNCSSDCNTPCKEDTDSGCLLCINKCNKNCIHEKCFSNGSCTDGCHAGFYGEDCIYRCPTECNTCESRDYCTSCWGEITGRYCKDIIEVIEDEDEANEKLQEASINYHNSKHETLTGDSPLKKVSLALISACLALNVHVIRSDTG